MGLLGQAGWLILAPIAYIPNYAILLHRNLVNLLVYFSNCKFMKGLIMLNKKAISFLSLLAFAGVIVADGSGMDNDSLILGSRSSRINRISSALVKRAQLKGIDKAEEKLNELDGLDKNERLAVLKFAAKKAYLDGDHITQQEFAEKYKQIKDRPSFLGKSTGFVSKAIGWGFSPVKKGLDGAFYATGAAVGLTTLGMLPLIILAAALQNARGRYNGGGYRPAGY